MIYTTCFAIQFIRCCQRCARHSQSFSSFVCWMLQSSILKHKIIRLWIFTSSIAERTYRSQVSQCWWMSFGQNAKRTSHKFSDNFPSVISNFHNAKSHIRFSWKSFSDINLLDGSHEWQKIWNYPNRNYVIYLFFSLSPSLPLFLSVAHTYAHNSASMWMIKF